MGNITPQIIKDYVIFKNSYHLITMDNDKDLAVQNSIEFLNSLASLNNSLVKQIG